MFGQIEIQNKKIGFITLSNFRSPIPSTRITVLNMLPMLKEHGFDPEIAYQPDGSNETPDLSNLCCNYLAEKFQIIYFQKVHGPSVVKLAGRLSRAGVKTVYGVCDRMDLEMTEVTDRTIVVSDYLKSFYPDQFQSKVRVVHDGIEHSKVYKSTWGNHRGSRVKPIHAVLVTSHSLNSLPLFEKPPAWLSVTIVGRYAPRWNILQRLRQTWWSFSKLQSWQKRINYLMFLSRWNIRRVPWEKNQVYEIMRQADIGIVPIEREPQHQPGSVPPAWKLKSENRLTMKMSVGLPVIASRIPSYDPVIEQGVTGYLAETEQDWIHLLNKLRNPCLRASIGVKARASVLERYSKERQAQLLLRVLREF